MGGARQQRFRTILFLLVGFGTTGLVLLIWGFGVLDSFERDSIDARFSIRGTQEPPAQIVVVAIDDVTTNAIRKYVWPYPRRFHARVLDRIAADHPKAIAVDIQFTEQTNRGTTTRCSTPSRTRRTSCWQRRRRSRTARPGSSAATRPCARSERARRARSSRPTRPE